MKKFLLCIPLLLMIAFELFVGINLFNDPVAFTQNVIVIFGVFMLILAVWGLIRWLRERSVNRAHTFTLVGAIIDLLIGILCVLKSDTVIKIFPILAMAYGVVMVIMGIYKIRNYIAVRTIGFRRPFLALIGGILTIILGVVIFLHPFTTMELIWQYAGIMLIMEAAFDLCTILFGVALF